MFGPQLMALVGRLRKCGLLGGSLSLEAALRVPTLAPFRVCPLRFMPVV